MVIVCSTGGNIVDVLPNLAAEPVADDYFLAKATIRFARRYALWSTRRSKRLGLTSHEIVGFVAVDAGSLDGFFRAAWVGAGDGLDDRRLRGAVEQDAGSLMGFFPLPGSELGMVLTIVGFVAVDAGSLDGFFPLPGVGAGIGNIETNVDCHQQADPERPWAKQFEFGNFTAELQSQSVHQSDVSSWAFFPSPDIFGWRLSQPKPP